MENQQGGVEQKGSYDEEGGPQSLTGKDLTHTNNAAMDHLVRRESRRRIFIQQMIMFKGSGEGLKVKEQNH